jgi:hypothetical protein
MMATTTDDGEGDAQIAQDMLGAHILLGRVKGDARQCS